MTPRPRRSEIARRLHCDAASVLASPYAWIGTVQEIRAAPAGHERRWGITRYVVRGAHLEAVDQVRAHVSSAAR
ncbi:hypothetical protein ACVW19_004396 [Streptomyces sp. TE5632]